MTHNYFIGVNFYLIIFFLKFLPCSSSFIFLFIPSFSVVISCSFSRSYSFYRSFLPCSLHVPTHFIAYFSVILSCSSRVSILFSCFFLPFLFISLVVLFPFLLISLVVTSPSSLLLPAIRLLFLLILLFLSPCFPCVGIQRNHLCECHGG